ncbi:MAG: redox-sensing transcriptional repressor Rex [Spirochaetaceae bacterium]|nr:MAG: redox-sensing transcriptional repressor Rex [Spirochaetaceae bacterium]
MSKPKLASQPTIKRLPSYLHVIENAQQEGKEFISGTVIAEELGLEPIQVRKDLAVTGIVGKPRIGFPVDNLIKAIYRFLRWDQDNRAIVVGAGNLGTALMGYREFNRRGLRIVAAFDPDKRKIGKQFHDTEVFALGQMAAKLKQLNAAIAILTVPSSHAQAVADLLVKCGIRAIWNFTNVKIRVPDTVTVQKEDLSSGYAVLSVRMNLPALVSK